MSHYDWNQLVSHQQQVQNRRGDHQHQLHGHHQKQLHDGQGQHQQQVHMIILYTTDKVSINDTSSSDNN